MENSKLEKQIEEITEILANSCKMSGCEECGCSEGNYPECALKYTADKLYNAGYRKASEVAREIFEEIETSLTIESFHGSGVYYAIRAEDYLHYKKKYTEDGK